MRIHVVKSGDSIYKIAQQYRVTPEKIISDNELKNPENLVVGQTLVILENPKRHVVLPGESFYSIAVANKISVNQLIAANPQITDPSQISAGEVITIPPLTINFGPIDVNGYAFPSISMNILRKTLPYLTYLSIFNYQASADGSLKNIPDEPLIQAARAQQVAPIMVVTNIMEGGGFSSDIAHSILTNEEAQNRLIANITRILREKNYYGLNLDIEYVYPYDRESYNNFIRRITRTLKPLGYPIFTALAPKISATQQGTLYEAHDYPVHGRTVDHVIIMTYEWGYTYSRPMAVAPINNVRKVLEYAVTEIPRRKIFMGIPNYGYNWNIPYKPGTAAVTISNTAAVELAGRVGAEIQFDRLAQSPFFRYYESSWQQHEVWFEDARSILAKLTLANEFRLGGVSYWTIGQFFPQNWLILNSVYKIRKVL